MRRWRLNLTILCLSILSYTTQAAQQPSERVVQRALQAYQYAKHKSVIKNTRYMSIVDFSKPSFQQRFYIYDLTQHKAIFSTLVAQGRGSGVGPYARRFSNHFHTAMSSLGVYVTTGGNYLSDHGRSIHVKGLQVGVNDNAARRAVEIHSAWYVSPEFAKRYHRVGNSLGCFAVSKQALPVLRHTIGNGSVLFAYAA